LLHKNSFCHALEEAAKAVAGRRKIEIVTITFSVT
jgi:hypothetical protein